MTMMVSDHNFEYIFTKGRAWKLYELGSNLLETTISTCSVNKSYCEFIPLTLRFNFSPENLSISAS